MALNKEDSFSYSLCLERLYTFPMLGGSKVMMLATFGNQLDSLFFGLELLTTFREIMKGTQTEVIVLYAFLCKR